MAEAALSGKDWNEQGSSKDASFLSKFRACFGSCFGPDEEVPHDEVAQPVANDARKLVLTNSIGSRSIKSEKSTKSFSTLSIGSFVSLRSHSGNLMALKYVDLYQKVFDAVSESFTKSYSPNERSAFPNQGLAVLVGKTPLHKEVEKGNCQLSLWSENIGKVSFSVVDHHSI